MSDKTNKRSLNRGKGIDGPISQAAVYTIMAIVVFLVLLPVLLTVMLSLKSNYDLLQGIWSIPTKIMWSNWKFGFTEILPNMLNSILIALVSTFFTVFIGAISAYVFVRMDFLGKNVLFKLVILLMLIPSIITLTPLYILCAALHIENTWFAIWFPTVAGGQVSAIFLFSTFFRQQPKELFEAAKIDGAGELKMFVSICLPLAIPVLCIQAVNSFASAYNDFLWPTIIIEETSKQPLMPVLKNLAQVAQSSGKQGVSYAMYLLSGIPLVFTTLFGLKYFVNGDFASGLKL